MDNVDKLRKMVRGSICTATRSTCDGADRQKDVCAASGRPLDERAKLAAVPADEAAQRVSKRGEEEGDARQVVLREEPGGTSVAPQATNIQPDGKFLRDRNAPAAPRPRTQRRMRAPAPHRRENLFAPDAPIHDGRKENFYF
mmetsp:Transcript_38319/g.74953  ORF Transcript_38319/g.74953 Transcript_38319/m.74953 type:complete len:142 (-) Transcript_38319:735-1160(-)